MKMTRKELAEFITKQRQDNVSVSQVRDNEKSWGLTEARGIDLNKRVVRYDFDKAVASLRKRKIIPEASKSSKSS